jgi:hypothetical protein
VGLETPAMLKGREELTPDYIFNTYWNSYWNNIDLLNSYSLMVKNMKYLSSFYLPSIHEYAEYDFKNWQSLDALEDSLWEVIYPSFLHDEYLRLKTSALYIQYFSKYFAPYNVFNRQFAPKFDLMSKPPTLDPHKFDVVSIYSDNFFFKPDLLNLTNFTHINNLLWKF